jgi:hypothetical protein
MTVLLFVEETGKCNSNASEGRFELKGSRGWGSGIFRGSFLLNRLRADDSKNLQLQERATATAEAGGVRYTFPPIAKYAMDGAPFVLRRIGREQATAKAWLRLEKCG